MLTSVLFASILMAAKLHGDISVPGYTPIVLAIMFFGGLASLGLSDNIYGFALKTAETGDVHRRVDAEI
jgi:hypothetical protein